MKKVTNYPFTHQQPDSRLKAASHKELKKEHLTKSMRFKKKTTPFNAWEEYKFDYIETAARIAQVQTAEAPLK